MRHIVLGLFVVAAACTSEVPLSPTRLASPIGDAARNQTPTDAQLPFDGVLQGTETGQLQPPTTLLVSGTGEGTATHLGRFTSTFTAVVDLATGSGHGDFAFIAANGDRVIATFTGQATPTSEPGVARIEETATITGGTGRFAGATGHFTIERVLQQATGVSSGSFNGTISFPH